MKILDQILLLDKVTVVFFLFQDWFKSNQILTTLSSGSFLGNASLPAQITAHMDQSCSERSLRDHQPPAISSDSECKVKG